MPKTKKWKAVLVRMPEEMHARLLQAEGLGGKVAPIVRKAVDAHLSGKSREESLSLAGVSDVDRKRIERFANALRRTPDEVKELVIDLGLGALEHYLRGR